MRLVFPPAAETLDIFYASIAHGTLNYIYRYIGEREKAKNTNITMLKLEEGNVRGV